jgi:hypothetical protein
MAGSSGRFREIAIPFWLGTVLLEHAELLESQAGPGEVELLLAGAGVIFERPGPRLWLDRVDRIRGADRVSA